MRNVTTTLLPALLVLCLFACKKDTPAVDYQSLDDQALYVEISGSAEKQTATIDALPDAALRQVTDEFFDTYIESVAFVPERGYEVTLATEDQAYFNLAGRRLERRITRLLGPCGALGGDLIPLDRLRPAIVLYVREHYPGVEILRAKSRGDRILVLLSSHVILVFSAAGVVEVSDLLWYDCRCAPAASVDFPSSVVTLLRARFPEAKPQRVCKRGDRIVVGALTATGRLILVFDANWNFLFSQP